MAIARLVFCGLVLTFLTAAAQEDPPNGPSATLPEYTESAMAKVPLDLETGTSVADVLKTFAPGKARELLDSVFGSTRLAPSVATRSSIRVSGTTRVNGSDIWAEGGEINVPQNPCVFTWNCIIIQKGAAQAAVLREDMSLFELLMKEYAKHGAQADCEREIAALDEEIRLKLPDFCGDSPGGVVDEPDQSVWLDAFAGFSLALEKLKPGSAEARMQAQAQRWTARPLPELCGDYILSGYDLILSVCGVFRHHTLSGVETISYCRLQRAPGVDEPPDRCVPLFLKTQQGWYYMSVAGFVTEPPGGGGAVDTCFFPGAASLPRARAIAAALQTLMGGSLRVTPRADGALVISGTRMNADFSAANRPRPFGYLSVLLRLEPLKSTEASLGVNLAYTVSAQRLEKRADGREVSEEEEGRINRYLWTQVRSAIAKTGVQPAAIECDS